MTAVSRFVVPALACVLLETSAVHAAPTLADACRAALARAPGVSRSRAAARAAAAGADAARAEMLPRLDFTAGTHAIGATDQGGPRTRPDRQESLSLRLEQAVFAGGALRARSLEAREDAVAAAHASARRREEIAHEAATLYLGVLEAREDLRQAEADLERRAAQAQGAGLRVKAGLLPKAEADQAEAERARAQAVVREVQGSLAEARGRLERLTGWSASEGLAAPPPLSVPRGEMLASAQQAAPAVLSARRSLAARRRGESAARGGLAPALVAGGSLRRAAEFPKTMQFVRDEASAFVEVRWTLFSGGGRLAGVRRARAETDAASARLEEARDLAAVDAIAAREAALSAQERLAALESRLAAARESYEAVRSRHEAGLEPALALREAAASLTSADAALSAARFQRERAVFDLHLALGTVEEAIMGSHPDI